MRASGSGHSAARGARSLVDDHGGSPGLPGHFEHRVSALLDAFEEHQANHAVATLKHPSIVVSSIAASYDLSGGRRSHEPTLRERMCPQIAPVEPPKPIGCARRRQEENRDTEKKPCERGHGLSFDGAQDDRSDAVASRSPAGSAKTSSGIPGRCRRGGAAGAAPRSGPGPRASGRRPGRTVRRCTWAK